MAVQNIECQIARGQLGRYLDGEGIGAEATRQLEAHFAKCPECREVLESKKIDLISQIPSSPAKVPPPASKLGHAVVSQVAVPAPKPLAVAEVAPSAPEAKGPNWKPIAYSAGLAVVLLGMSYFGKNGFEILGPKAAASLPAAAADVPTPTASDQPAAERTGAPLDAVAPPISQNEIVDLASTVAALPTLPGIAESSLPKVQRLQVAARPSPKRRSARRSKPRSTIRVYDASGAPISN